LDGVGTKWNAVWTGWNWVGIGWNGVEVGWNGVGTGGMKFGLGRSAMAAPHQGVPEQMPWKKSLRPGSQKW